MRILFLLLAVFCADMSSARAEPLALTPYIGNFVVMEVHIEGERARLLFDTGAGITSITPAFAARIGCAPAGAIAGFRVSGERVTFQKCSDMSVVVGARRVVRELGVFDLGAVLPAEWPPLDGVVGLDIFDGAGLTLNLAERQLSLGRRHGSGWQEGQMRPQREMGGMGLTVFARVEADGGSIWMLVDSGNMGPTLLSPGALGQLGAAAPSSLSVSGVGPHPVEASPLPTAIYDGNLSWGFLRDFEIALDLRRNRIWWRPARRADHP